MKIFGFEINKSKQIVNVAPVTDPVPESLQIRRKIKYEQGLQRVRQDISKWNNALNAAEDINYPQRMELYRIYKDIMTDAHLSALVETRKNAILGSDFLVRKNKKIVEDKTEFLNSHWFFQFTDLALDSIFWGHSLIQFNDFIDGEFTDLEIVPRHYVKPELGIVVTNTQDFTGENYLDPKYKKWVVSVGEKRDLGLLAKAAPLVLWKRNALSSWAIFNESYSVPIRILKTNLTNEDTIVEAENMLKNLASAAYGIIKLDDELELHETNNSDVYQVFDKMIDRCNSELSKLILGQNSSSEEKAYVGSAEVHERVMFMINERDEVFIENIFKYKLIPLLNAHNLGWNNVKIEAKEDDDLSLMQRAKIETDFLNTGLFTIAPSELLERYGTKFIPISQPTTPTTSTQEPGEIQNKLDLYYGE